MSELDDRLTSLRKRVTLARQARTQADQLHAIAADRAQQLVKELEEKFGVSTISEAQDLLADMEDELAALAAVAEAELGKAAVA